MYSSSPSGSGKSTLLNCLSGSVPKKSLKIYGELITPFEENPIFVQQEDLFFTQLTVEETLTTSAILKSFKQQSPSSSVSIDNKISNLNKKNKLNSLQKARNLINHFVLDLGLKKVIKTVIGDAKTKGISGGEKKRLSIGNELIGATSTDTTVTNQEKKVLIFCDEPTSGLDSYQAEKVMELLKKMAKRGNTVIASIHQPRSSIVKMFDDVTLISEGKVIYTGEAQTMSTYFKKLGYPCPNNVNPAEFYIDLVSIDYSSEETERSSKERITDLSNQFIDTYGYHKLKTDNQKFIDASLASSSSHATVSHHDTAITSHKFNRNPIRACFQKIKNSLITFKVLYVRAFKQITRDKALNIARFMSNLFSGLLFGTIYYQLSDSASTVADRLGLLQVASVNTAMLALIKAV